MPVLHKTHNSVSSSHARCMHKCIRSLLFLSCILIHAFCNLTVSSWVSSIVTITLVLAVSVPLLRANLTQRQRVGVNTPYFFEVFVIVASALCFATLLWNDLCTSSDWLVTDWDLPGNCAQTSAKLLLHPLDMEQYYYYVGMETTRLSQVDMKTLIYWIITGTQFCWSVKARSVSEVYTRGVETTSRRADSQKRLPVVTHDRDGVVVLG